MPAATLTRRPAPIVLEPAPPLPPLPAGARHLRDVVRLSPASRRRRVGGLIHIERPPMILNGARLDFSVSALCGTGLAGVHARRIGIRVDATCRRCRNAARHRNRNDRLVWPLWVPERGLGRPVPEQARGWPDHTTED